VGYKVYYGTSSANLSQSVDVGNSLSATIQNLADGETYYFVATDYTSTGIESAASNMVLFNNAAGNSAGSATPTAQSATPTAGNGTPTITSAAATGSTLLWRNTSSGFVGLWQMHGTGIAANPLLGQTDPSWNIVGVGDFSGNGESDILWSNSELANSVSGF
jgi:hypothetical protein